MSTKEARQRYDMKKRIINKKPFIISYTKTLSLFLVGFLIIQTLCTFADSILGRIDYIVFPLSIIALVFVSCYALGMRNMYLGLKSSLTTTLLIHIIYMYIVYRLTLNQYISDNFVYFPPPVTMGSTPVPEYSVPLFIFKWLYYIFDSFSARLFQMFAPMAVYIITKAKEIKSQNANAKA